MKDTVQITISVRPKKKKKKKKAARKPNAAFMKPLTPSPELARIIGDGPMPRTSVVKELWKYIKEHDLQCPRNRRNIIADENLEAIFRKKEVSMFEMNKLVARHLS